MVESDDELAPRGPRRRRLYSAFKASCNFFCVNRLVVTLRVDTPRLPICKFLMRMPLFFNLNSCMHVHCTRLCMHRGLTSTVLLPTLPFISFWI